MAKSEEKEGVEPLMEKRYPLSRGGFVFFDWSKDVQSIQPLYENTKIILRNGLVYILEGRGYGV